MRIKSASALLILYRKIVMLLSILFARHPFMFGFSIMSWVMTHERSFQFKLIENGTLFTFATDPIPNQKSKYCIIMKYVWCCWWDWKRRLGVLYWVKNCWMTRQQKQSSWSIRSCRTYFKYLCFFFSLFVTLYGLWFECVLKELDCFLIELLLTNFPKNKKKNRTAEEWGQQIFFLSLNKNI